MPKGIKKAKYHHDDLFGSLEQEPEYVVIDKKVNHIIDLIEIGKEYDPTKIYNIDVKTLYYLIPSLTELNDMIGMTQIKNDILDFILFQIQQLEHHDTMMHTIISGSPGCGKTEVARIIGKIYLAMGILKNNIFIKATRSQLIAGYVGQTAILTQKVIDMASGGILFIDEVYSLGNPEKRDSFSKECIDTINENLTVNKNNFILIVAGYKDDIKTCFLDYNIGLERRFPVRFIIDSYNAEELFLIFKKKVIQSIWSLDDSITVSFFEKNYDYFTFSGGDIENLFNYSKRCHSRRIFGTNEIRKKITIDDLEKAFSLFIKNNDKDKKESIWKNMFS